MNSYPDPTQTTSEPLPSGEPEYREYPPVSIQPPERIYPSAPSFPPDLHPPMANMPVPPMPYPYSPTGQSFQTPTSQPTSSFPVAKPNSRRWIFLLGSIGLAILALAGVLIYAILQSSAPSSNITNTSATPTGHNTSQPGVVSLGQSITIQGLICTVTSVDPLTPDTTTHPDAGNKFLVVHVRLQNDHNAAQFYSSFDFHVFSGDNQERGVEIIVPDTYTGNRQLIEDDLPPDEMVQGDLIIQVPVNDHNVKLGWSPGNVSSDSAYEWNLGL